MDTNVQLLHFTYIKKCLKGQVNRLYLREKGLKLEHPETPTPIAHSNSVPRISGARFPVSDTATCTCQTMLWQATIFRTAGEGLLRLLTGINHKVIKLDVQKLHTEGKKSTANSPGNVYFKALPSGPFLTATLTLTV